MAAVAHAPRGWAWLALLVAGMLLIPLHARAEPDLRLPPLPDGELPAFADVAEPPQLAGSLDAVGSQPTDATAAVPDDPSRRSFDIPPELLKQRLPAPPEEAARMGPDYLEVDGNPEYSKGIVRVRGGGVRLVINSLISGATLEVEADSAVYNTTTGEAEMSGAVQIGLADAGLLLRCSYFNYDPLMQRMRIEGLELELPLSLLPPGTLPRRPVRPSFSGHFYTPDPEVLRVRSQLCVLDYNPRRRVFELAQVKLSASSHPDPDFYITARSLSIGTDQRLLLKGIEVRMSGLKILEWPSYKRGAGRERQPVSFGFPSVSVDRNDGLSWKQPITLNFRHYQAEAVADFADEYGLLLSTRVTQELSPAASLSLRSGVRNAANLERERVERGDSLLSEMSYDVKLPGWGVDRLRLNAEYGTVTETIPRRPGSTAIRQTEAQRFAASGTVDFTPLPLGGGAFLTLGGRASYVDYGGLGDSYSVVGGEAGLVIPAPKDDFNNYVVYRLRSMTGTPRMSFDEVRRSELDFAGQLRLQPGWRQTLHGVYDIDGERFDTLELGTMRRQRSYEVGMYYDFARESAGLELGLLVD